MKTKLTLVSAVALVLALSSCKKQEGPAGADGSQGPSGPALTGSLKGYISHYDLSGVKMQTGLSGDTVKIDGTSKMAVTDANGMYVFNGLTTGNYNLSINKYSFGSTKVQSIPFAGGGDLYRNANISKIPTTTVVALSAATTTISTLNYVSITGTVVSAPTVQAVIIFVGNPGTIISNSTSGNNVTYYVVNIPANSTTFTKNIATYEFYDAGYSSGNAVFLSAYMIGANTNASTYVDFTNNRTVFTAISFAPAYANVTIQ